MIVGASKPWAYDPEWITAEALKRRNLGKLLLKIGCEEPLGTLPLPWWWFSLPPDVAFARRVHGIVGPSTVMWRQSRPEAGRMLLVHQPTGQWMDLLTGGSGMALLGLVQQRLDLSPAKAAWFVAKKLGFERPVPPVPPVPPT